MAPASPRPLVVYHSPCMDGAGARLAAWLAFGERADYLGADYGADESALIDACRGREVYMADVSFPRPTMEALVQASASLRVVDHHATAQKALAGLPDVLFDMEKSGAVLAFHDLHPGKPLPLLFAYLQDHDLYKFELPHSRELYMAVSGQPQEVGAYARMAQEFDDPKRFAELVRDGAAILAWHDLRCEELLASAAPVVLEGFEGLALNFDGPKTMANRIGQRLAQISGTFGCLWRFDPASGEARISLRSTGEVDVSAVASSLAEAFGARGGGHPKSSGTSIPADAWMKILRKESRPSPCRP